MFFTGKGGVGKTSMASSVALGLAERGKRVLLISTDPASNLDEVLETPLSSTPTLVSGVAGLWALNLTEANRASVELGETGLLNQHLIVNGVFTTENSDDALALAFAEKSRARLAQMPMALRLCHRHRLVFVHRELWALRPSAP